MPSSASQRDGRPSDQVSARGPSQTEKAYARLKHMIISGEIAPADLVDANRLVDVLGLGRTPVREALLRLQTEGILRIVPKRGVRIVTLSADDLTEVYQVISTLEVEAVRLLTLTRPTEVQLCDLFVASECMIAAATAGEREDWMLADEEFHRTLLLLNPNRRLRDAGLLHRDLAQRAHFVALRLLEEEDLVRSSERHHQLVRLIAEGDVAAVVASHRAQRERGATMLVDILRRYRLTQL